MSIRQLYHAVLVIIVAVMISSCVAANTKKLSDKPPSGDGRRPKCYLPRDNLRLAVLPVVNNSDCEYAAAIFDESTTGIFEEWRPDYKKRCDTVKILTPRDVISYTASQGITLHDIWSTPNRKLGEKFDVDFIIHNKIYQVGPSSRSLVGKEIWGQAILVEATSNALVWWCEWVIYKENPHADYRIMDNLIEGFSDGLFFDPLEFCIKHGCYGIFSRVPVIGRPLPDDKKTHNGVIDLYGR